MVMMLKKKIMIKMKMERNLVVIKIIILIIKMIKRIIQLKIMIWI